MMGPDSPLGGALLLVASLTGSAAHACAGLVIADGAVATADNLPASAELGPAAGCVGEISKSLAANRNLRTVTITVRVSDAARADGSGDAVLKAYEAAMIAGGLAGERLSGVVAGSDGDSVVAISYSERRSVGSVGSVLSANGTVSAGLARDSLAPALAGGALVAGTWIVTAGDSHASLSLADGSSLRLMPETELFVGKLHLDEDLNRVVELEVAAGVVEADVAKASGASTFQTHTPYGVAGVRGTVFRLSANESMSRLETLEGAVVLTGDAGEAEVAAGFGSAIDSSGAPTSPSKLPSAPRVKTPLEGPMTAKGLKWAGAGASYVVELARDAEFLVDTQLTSVDSRGHLPALESGDWYWRVAAVDAAGFTGLWSSVHRFHVD